MSLLPFGLLPPARPRAFLPAKLDLGDWAEIAPWFDELERRAAAVDSPAALERWLIDRSELSAALDEEGARRHVAMTCHTEDVGAEQAYLHFVEEIEPRIKPRQFGLDRLYLAHPCRARLDPRRYEVFNRHTQAEVDLFREANVPLETEDAKLGQQYQKLSGSLTVPFRGEERTLVQMGRYLEEPDHQLREEAWRLVADRRLREAERFEALFEAMLGLRRRMAANAGCASFVDYTFRRLERFDYTPEDCRSFHDSIEHEILPAVRDLQAERRRELGVQALRPWDLAVDPLNRPPLRPFRDVGELLDRSQRIFDRLDPTLGADFRRLRELRLLDLENRKGKAPGGYQSTLAEVRLPFIFMNAVGLQRDVETLLHEAGHAFHALAVRDEDLFTYRTNVPMEFCEVASMSMELLGGEWLEEFHPPIEASRARRTHLEGILNFFPWMAVIDAFQHWLYTHPDHGRAERRGIWLELMDRFGGDVDWSGLEEMRACLWHRQLHLFIHPFYYVEYGIAQLGALQVWANSKRDVGRALADYRRALALGGSRPLPELFAAAGCRLDFSRNSIAPLVGRVREELAGLAEPSA